MNPHEVPAGQTSTDEPSAPVQPSRHRSRLAKLLIVAGAVVSLAPLGRLWPSGHQIDFRLEDGVADVTRFDVEWTHMDGDVPGDVVSGSSRSFERGRAPEIVNVNVHLPNGSYALDIRIEHADHIDSITKRVTLGDADKISIPLRADRARP
jgi:hypothetical protein